MYHKTNFSKLKKTEVIPSIFSDHSGMKLGTKNRTGRKFTKMWIKHLIKRHTPTANGSKKTTKG